ncbi:Uncharacterized protein APZ42_031528 [Daphnia magna]|uniref:Uncharacterized protein n=1 Tax=Daphnia magna TaxID=35525 RepID=A0A164MSX4_9CRUS|nr:Uncharacterized protein APZ42_031528 [Daphnia magna]
MKHSTIRHRTIVLLEAYSAQLMSSGTSNRSHWLTTFSPMCQQYTMHTFGNRKGMGKYGKHFCINYVRQQ